MSEIDSKIYDFFYPCLAVAENNFIEAHIDVPRPNKPYVDFQVVSNGTFGSETSEVDVNGNQTINHTKMLVVQLNFYGSTALEDAELFLLHLDMEMTLLRGEVLNFGLLSTTAPVDTSAQIAKTWERRYTVRVTLSHSAAVLDQVGLIEHVEITGDFS